MAEEQEKEVVEAEAVEAETEEQAAEQQSGGDDTEARARETGWVPKEEWRGSPDKWKPAEQWLERGDSRYVPKLEEKITALERQVQEAQRTLTSEIEKAGAQAARALKAQRKALEAEFEARKEKAVELGDTDAYKAAVKAEKAAYEELTEKAEEKADKKEAPKANEVEQKWLDENAWFGKDRRLTRYAYAMSEDVAEEMSAASQREQLAELDRRLRDQFPEAFGVKARGNGAGKVESGSRTANGGGGGRSKWTQVPDADRKLAEQNGIVEMFLRKGETMEEHRDKARERYAASYLEDAR